MGSFDDAEYRVIFRDAIVLTGRKVEFPPYVCAGWD